METDTLRSCSRMVGAALCASLAIAASSPAVSPEAPARAEAAAQATPDRSAPAAAVQPDRTAPEPVENASYVVVLDHETRWDAWLGAVLRARGVVAADAGDARDAVALAAGAAPTSDERAAGAAPYADGVSTRARADESTAGAPAAEVPADTRDDYVPAAARDLAPDELAAAGAAARRAELEIADRTALVASTVQVVGGRVLARYDTALAGLLISVPVDESPHLLDQLAVDPSVRRVSRAPQASVALKDSVPSTGADQAYAALGVDGTGATIAIVDTGIDYTHAVFGGPGTSEAYEAAAADPTNPGTTWQGEPLFPNAKVVGGHDFAGELYTPGCTQAGVDQGVCSPVPGPDPDPLDAHGHGTHVASIASGYAHEPVGAGVAPGAELIGLKIFGSTGLTELVVDPLEWAIEANMGAPGRPHVDVLNMSLGQRYGSELLEEEAVVRRAVEAGVVVVASAGNDSNLPFIAAAPAIAVDALAVASHSPPGNHMWTAELTPPGGEPLPKYDEVATHFQDWSPDPRGEVAAPVVYIGRGCPGSDEGDPRDPYVADPQGAIAMFDMAWGAGGPSCTADTQALRAQQSGAVGVLMAAGIGLETASWWEGTPIVDVPVWMVNHVLEQAIKEYAQPDPAPSEAQPFIRLAPLPKPNEDYVVDSYSSRGPARTTALKPDISAPGSGIYAAAIGQGYRGIAWSGTSMSAPHVAGAAAILWQRERELGRSVSARDVAALLVNTANPSGVRESPTDPGTPPMARVGGGALDVWAAVNAGAVARSEAIATFNLGLDALVAERTENRSITLHNISEEPRRYRVTPRFRDPDDELAGLELTLEDEVVRLGPGASTQVPVGVRIDPSRLPYWGLLGGKAVGDREAMADSEIDGWLEVADVTETGGDGQEPDTLGIPFYLLARHASQILAEWSTDATGGISLDLTNSSPFSGDAELFTLVATDRPDSDVLPKVDVDAVGVRTRPDGDGNTIVEFALHTRGVRIYPLETETLIHLDLDMDGTADWMVYTEDEEYLRTGVVRNGRVKVAFEPIEGSPFGSPIADHYAYVDLRSRFTVLPVTIEHTGLTPSTLAFRFRVQQRDFVEKDAYRDPQYDQVPGGGRWLLFDGRSPAPVPTEQSLFVQSGATLSTTVTQGADPGLGVMVLLPMNQPGDGDMALFMHPREPVPSFLPMLWSGRAEAR
ncbi:MAG: S8 family serine peptidase [Anaerolineae bacterium]